MPVDNNDINVQQQSDLGNEQEVEVNYSNDDIVRLSCYQNSFALKTDNLKAFKINAEEFQKGINSVSSVCGAICALVSVGVNIQDALVYISDKEAALAAADYTCKVASINKEAQIESSKYGQIISQQNSI